MSGPARWVRPVVLEGSIVRLEPLSLEHLEGLAAVGLEPSIWRWMPTLPRDADELRAWVDAALEAQAAGRELPFAQVERASGRPVGSTRLLNIEPAHRRLEIGYTWLAPAWQRTALNSEAKLLLLRHAFEALDPSALRVEFKTDARNVASRRALAGIGATEEGTLRRHMLVQGGERRDSVYFSVIAEEWPAVRQRLAERVARLAGAATMAQEATADGT
jgi:RimJ/RimL family protein N-acetyltransferase